jgi:23S rRNA pseudouridine2605 synthase
MGIASRRKAEELIREGRITIHGQVARLGDKADPMRDPIKVDGRRIVPSTAKYYVLMNKPKGFVTTTDDPEGRPTVMDLLKRQKPWIFPVGRLDYDAEGFLLLTNDGDLNYRLSHPSFQIPRTYLVKVKGKPTPEVMERLSRGIQLEDGRTAPCQISPMKETEENRWVRMTLHEGRNRQIKRMWERMGHMVLKIKRVNFAGLALGKLRPGEYRDLLPREVEKLMQMTRKDQEKGEMPRGGEKSTKSRRGKSWP